MTVDVDGAGDRTDVSMNPPLPLEAEVDAIILNIAEWDVVSTSGLRLRLRSEY